MRIEKLPILILYPHSRCNCRCVMCDIWKTDTVQEISAADLERHVEDMQRLQVRWVVFSGGEPLMHSDLFRLAAMLRGLGIRTTILSTGLLLQRYASPIIEHIDDVIVSLDGPRQIHDSIRRVPRAYEILADGVNALHGIPVSARSTIQRMNHAHLLETVAAAKELGLASISFLAADVSSAAFNRIPVWTESRQDEIALRAEEIRILESQMEPLGADPFVVETPEKLQRIVQHFRARLGLAEAVAPRCNAPWVSAVVESDGHVRPCFFHPAIGNMRRQSLAEAINSPEAMKFRSSLDVASNPICRTCVCSLHLT